MAWEVHSLALTWLALATPAWPSNGSAAEGTAPSSGREAAVRAAARLRGELVSLRTGWAELRAAPAENACRAHVAAAAEVGRLANVLGDAFERMAAEAGGRATVEGRAALAGLDESRHQARAAALHAEQVEALCSALPRVSASSPNPSPAAPRREVCADGTSVSSADGVIFIAGPATEPWSRAGGGRHVLGVMNHVELEPPEIVVVRLHGTRLAAEGLRASVRLAEPAAGQGPTVAPAEAPWTRAVVVLGADDVNPDAAVNFATLWAFAPRGEGRPCRAGAVDAWWFSEGTAVLSFGRRGRIAETSQGVGRWQPLEAVGGGAHRFGGRSGVGVPYTPAERELMGLVVARGDSAEAPVRIRWLAAGADTGRETSDGAPVCESERGPTTRPRRRPGVGPSMRLVIVSTTELSAQERAGHLSWWRAYTAADRDSRPETMNFFEASGWTAAPSVLPEPRLHRACGGIAADLP